MRADDEETNTESFALTCVGKFVGVFLFWKLEANLADVVDWCLLYLCVAFAITRCSCNLCYFTLKSEINERFSFDRLMCPSCGHALLVYYNHNL